jgi:hypothetical protein
MELLAALGAAPNITKIVDFSSCSSRAVEMYEAADGRTPKPGLHPRSLIGGHDKPRHLALSHNDRCKPYPWSKFRISHQINKACR